MGTLADSSCSAFPAQRFIEKMGHAGIIGMRVFPNPTQTIDTKSDPDSREVHERHDRSPGMDV